MKDGKLCAHSLVDDKQAITDNLSPFLERSGGLQEQEGAYSTTLGWTDRFRLREAQIELLTARGESLLFEPLPEEARAALKGPTWSLLAFVEPNAVEGMPTPSPLTADVREGTEITITIEVDTLRGSARCNSYEAAYTLDGSALNIENRASTLAACEKPEGVLAQEGRYLGILTDVIAGHVYGRQLWLETGDGRALVFGPAADWAEKAAIPVFDRPAKTGQSAESGGFPISFRGFLPWRQYQDASRYA